MTRATASDGLVVALATLWLLTGCGEPHNAAAGQQPGFATLDRQGDRDLTSEEILDQLSAANVSPGRLSKAISDLSMEARTNPVACEVLESLWDAQPPAAFDAKYLTVPMVRLSLASLLHRCPGKSNGPQYYDYVISVLDQSPDESDRMRAAISLGAVGSDQDVERLRSYALGSSTRMAVGAVGGLSLLNSAAAKQALKEIAANTGLARDVRESAENALKQ